MAGVARWWPGLALGLIGVIGLLGSVEGGPGTQTAAPILAGRPECPHDWDFKGQQMAIVGSNIDIPEFHDCQRFIVVNGGDTTYQALYAIFAADTLRRLDSIVAGSWVAMAEVYAEGTYPYLGIVSAYSCLMMTRRADSLYEARMVPSRSGPDVDCQELPTDAPGRSLTVHVGGSGATRFIGSDFPPVARWDWDSLHHKQFIGVKCGAAWCEVGDSDLRASPYPSSNLPVATPAQSQLARTRLIKGWYDEQLLAVRDQNGNTVTSPIRGIIYPDPALNGYTRLTQFDSSWMPVAYVALEVPPGTPATVTNQYKNRLNFDVTIPGAGLRLDGRLNRMYLCRGTAKACEVTGVVRPCSGDLPAWWTRVDPAGGGPPRYYCAIRRGHDRLALHIPGHRVPGTARWRWLASDEGTWKACVQGCCETGGS